MDTDLGNAAFHEAGHAVAAMHFGIAVVSINLSPQKASHETKPRTFGECTLREGWTETVDQFHAAMILHAGFAAQRIRFPKVDRLDVLLSSFVGDSQKMENLGIPLSIHKSAERAVRALLREKWDIVEGLAAALEIDGFARSELLEEIRGNLMRESI